MMNIIIRNINPQLKRKGFYLTADFLIAGGSTKTSCTLSIVNPSVDFVISSSTALLTGIAIFFKNEFLSKIKKKINKMRRLDKNNYFALWETLQPSIIDKNINQKRR